MNRMSIDTEGVYKLLTNEPDTGDKYANNKSEIIQSMIKAELLSENERDSTILER